MGNKFFLHEVRMGNSSQKGIVICDTLDAALQGYHAYLGAYAYGHDPDTTFCQAMITDMNGTVHYAESWIAPTEEPVEE